MPRGRPIQTGDYVLWRFYNTPEHHFYGPVHAGQVHSVLDNDDRREYRVMDVEERYHRLHRREILRVTTKEDFLERAMRGESWHRAR